MTLRDEIIAKCPSALLASRDEGAIAAAVSAGRTQLVDMLIGYGTVLDVLGPVEGAAVLDALEAAAVSVPAIKWAMKLLDRGELDVSKASTRGQIDALTGTILTPTQAAAIKALAERPDPVSEYDVRCAMWDEHGNWMGG